ncbi:MAG: Serine protease Do [Parcubacteria group bacterium GW2011_GWF1_45_5]|nr:MAG: Serine protease Do [Parcubacteria group bacterium GW2011_GWF1_45_5]
MATIPSIIKKALPALVGVVMVKTASSSRDRGVMPEEFHDQGIAEVETGSGFFVSGSGLVVTNRHVVFEPTAEYVISWQGNKYPARVVSRGSNSDTALLQAELKGPTPFLKLGNSRTIALGESVIALGNVLGELQNTVSVGIVSGLSRNIYAVDEVQQKAFELRGMIQTDAAINPGNSGGPLLNTKGEAIGVNTATITSYENIGFAIPIHRVKLDMEEVKRFGRIRTPYLGLRYVILDDVLAKKYGIPVGYGAYVLKDSSGDGKGVEEGSPADKAGIKGGDVVLLCDGEMITSNRTLRDILFIKEIGKKLKMMVLRGEKEFETTIVLEEK